MSQDSVHAYCYHRYTETKNASAEKKKKDAPQVIMLQSGENTE